MDTDPNGPSRPLGVNELQTVLNRCPPEEQITQISTKFGAPRTSGKNSRLRKELIYARRGVFFSEGTTAREL